MLKRSRGLSSTNAIVLIIASLISAFAFGQEWLGDGPPVYTAVFERWDVSIKDDREHAPTLHRNYDLVGVSVARPWLIYGPHASIFATALFSTRSGGDEISTLPNHHYLHASNFALAESGGKWTYQLGAWSLAPLIYLRLPLDFVYWGRNSFFGAFSGGAGLLAGLYVHRAVELSLRISGESSLIDHDHRQLSGLSGRLGLTYTF